MSCYRAEYERGWLRHESIIMASSPAQARQIAASRINNQYGSRRRYKVPLGQIRITKIS